MGLEMKPGSNNWYGRYRDGDKIRQFVLDAVIYGVRPARISETGDADFEQSRGEAKKEFALKLKQLRGDPTAERLVQQLVKIKTGREVTFAKMAELPALWEAIPRRRPPNAQYSAQCKGVLKRFAEFVAKEQPGATEFVRVTPETAKAFMDAETGRKLSPKTWNDTLKLLRTTFKHLHPQLTDGSNPFHGLITKTTETVNREPFSPAELKAVIEASAGDSFIRPIILTGMCTAMRKGDCCTLRWKDVDLEEEFVTVKTSKTGETAEIPMFPMLKEELRRRDRARRSGALDVEARIEGDTPATVPALTGAGRRGKAIGCITPRRTRTVRGKSEFCFPEQAALYLSNPTGITWHVKQVLAEAMKKVAVAEGRLLPELPEDEVRRRAEAYLATLPASARTDRMREVFTHYIAGQNANEVMAATGLSKATVSGHLNDIELHIQCAFIRGKVRATKEELLQEKREGRNRDASVRDFHSFRVTWITLALAAGIPLEIVQRVTGHRTVDIVLKHYFRPDRQDFRQTIMDAMPEMLTAPTGQKALPAGPLTDSARSPQAGSGRAEPGETLEEALKALEAMNPRSWKKQREAVTELIRQAKETVDTRIVREVPATA